MKGQTRIGHEGEPAKEKIRMIDPNAFFDGPMNRDKLGGGECKPRHKERRKTQAESWGET